MDRSRKPLVAALLFAAVCHVAAAAEPTALDATVAKRLHGDRTGACFAVAVVDAAVERSFMCARAGEPPRIDATSAFEIGSVSKTFTSLLLADLIERGQADLDDPLSDYLPEGAEVPDYRGNPIRLRHLVTHTSGLPPLPPGNLVTNPADPYAALTPGALTEALGKVTLDREPGARFEYSNFASMLLSYAVARRGGSDFGTLLDKRVFTPLGMDGAHLADPPAGVRTAQGHTPNAQVTGPWRFHTDLSGVGGIRATLDDMVRYVQAHLGQRTTPLDAALRRTREPVETKAARPMAMNWMLAPVAGRSIHAHEGGTAGFSSFVAIDAQARRGVVILSDTALTSLGGLGSLGLHLLDPSLPLGSPRKAIKAPTALLLALEGTWQLQGGPRMELRRKADALELQVPGQPAFALGHDDAGDFYPLAFDAVLRPKKNADGTYQFTWHQGGGAMAARRVESAAAAPAPATATRTAAEWEAYAGEYPLAASMSLVIRSKGGGLEAQATGQGSFPLSPVSGDVFEAPDFGIRIRFERNADGKVTALSLEQGGRTLRGERR